MFEMLIFSKALDMFEGRQSRDKSWLFQKSLQHSISRIWRISRPQIQHEKGPAVASGRALCRNFFPPIKIKGYPF